jgi:hypothetical protein
LGKAEQKALADAWKRKRHAMAIARIESLRAGLTEFNRLSSLLSGFALSICAEQNEKYRCRRGKRTAGASGHV